MQITDSPTFCPAPWTGLNIDQTGRVSPCMHCQEPVGNIKKTPIKEIIHGAGFADIREHMARSEWHPVCHACKRLEQTTGVSGRTVQQLKPAILSAIENDPANYFRLDNIAINWSNLCNLTCVYCNPGASTAWQGVEKIPINFVKNDHQGLLELAREHGHTITKLTLGGGEPLLQKGLLEFLKCLNPTRVYVTVTTNISIDLASNPIYNKLRYWPHVKWFISFDNANQDKFEYVRAGASWEIFVTNIRLMKAHAQEVVAHPAYSIYCAMDLIEYYEFCTALDLDIFWCELIDPEPLDIRRYSKKLRRQAIAEIDRVVAQFGHKKNLAIDTLLGYQMTLVDNSYLGVEFTPATPVAFHQTIEKKLNKTVTFSQLWPVYDNI